MHQLTDLGFGPFFHAQLADATSADLVLARIATEHRGGYEVWAEAGEGLAQLAGRLEGGEAPGVGDWVTLQAAPSPDEAALITGALTRRTVFTRGASGRQAREQVIAANVDIVFIVCGLDEDYSLRRVQRYLARVWASGAQPVVVLNKADACDEASDRVLEIEGGCPGVSVLATSAREAVGLEDLEAMIRPGLTAAFVGSSGVGKSTMINALTGQERMSTRETRAYDGRGRHTTSHRQLVRLPGGGLLLDTPGMRELQLADDEGLDEVFPEVEELSEGCRFRDCGHGAEPGCAVRQAVDSGELPAERLDHYLELEREASANALRRDEHQRRKSERVWGQLYEEGRRIRRWKEDGGL
jgi:ribosome biogenesis GTPase / thiamine phosphate phosphatase